MSAKWVGWAGVALLCGCAILAGILELMLVPLYVGGTVVPIAVVMSVLSNVVFPLLARELIRRTLAIGLPFLAWLLVVVVVGFIARPEGDVILPGGDVLKWVSYGVVLLGALAGTVTVVWASAPERPQRPRPASR